MVQAAAASESHLDVFEHPLIAAMADLISPRDANAPLAYAAVDAISNALAGAPSFANAMVVGESGGGNFTPTATPACAAIVASLSLLTNVANADLGLQALSTLAQIVTDLGPAGASAFLEHGNVATVLGLLYADVAPDGQAMSQPVAGTSTHYDSDEERLLSSLRFDDQEVDQFAGDSTGGIANGDAKWSPPPPASPPMRPDPVADTYQACVAGKVKVARTILAALVDTVPWHAHRAIRASYGVANMANLAQAALGAGDGPLAAECLFILHEWLDGSAGASTGSTSDTDGVVSLVAAILGDIDAAPDGRIILLASSIAHALIVDAQDLTADHAAVLARCVGSMVEANLDVFHRLSWGDRKKSASFGDLIGTKANSRRQQRRARDTGAEPAGPHDLSTAPPAPQPAEWASDEDRGVDPSPVLLMRAAVANARAMMESRLASLATAGLAMFNNYLRYALGVASEWWDCADAPPDLAADCIGLFTVALAAYNSEYVVVVVVAVCVCVCDFVCV